MLSTHFRCRNLTVQTLEKLLGAIVIFVHVKSSTRPEDNLRVVSTRFQLRFLHHVWQKTKRANSPLVFVAQYCPIHGLVKSCSQIKILHDMDTSPK